MKEKITNVAAHGGASVAGNAAVGGRATVRGKVVVDHDLKVNGFLDAPNIKSTNLGAFKNVADLTAAYPHPRDGQYAYVETEVEQSATPGGAADAGVGTANS